MKHVGGRICYGRKKENLVYRHNKEGIPTYLFFWDELETVEY